MNTLSVCSQGTSVDLWTTKQIDQSSKLSSQRNPLKKTFKKQASTQRIVRFSESQVPGSSRASSQTTLLAMTKNVSDLTEDECLAKFLPFTELSLKKLKRAFPMGWIKVKNTKFRKIGQDSGFTFGIFCLKRKRNLFWSSLEQDHDCRIFVLFGCCTIQVGNTVKQYTSGDTVTIKKTSDHSFITGKAHECVIGYVHSNVAGQPTYRDLKYSRLRRESVMTDMDFIEIPLAKSKYGQVSKICTRFFNSGPNDSFQIHQTYTQG